MFSTLMSLEDGLILKLKVKTEKYGYNAGPPMAIPKHTVLLYCVIPIAFRPPLSDSRIMRVGLWFNM